MKTEPGKIGWNKDYVKSLSKEDFLKEFTPHYGEYYNLSAEYDAIVPPAKKEVPKEPEKAK